MAGVDRPLRHRRPLPVMGAERVRSLRGHELNVLRGVLRDTREWPGVAITLHLDAACHEREPCGRCVPLRLVVGARA